MLYGLLTQSVYGMRIPVGGLLTLIFGHNTPLTL